MTELSWLWAPITVTAALAQTLRNTAQRHLTKELGALGATLVRFLYGLPFAALWVVMLHAVTGRSAALELAQFDLVFLTWTLTGAAAQIAATALLLRTMTERNFALGVAYSKTEVMQIAVFAVLLLGDPLSPGTAGAILLASSGVVLLSLPAGERSWRSVSNWTGRAALFGLGSGAAFAVSAVSYRGAALSLADSPAVFAAAHTLLWAQAMQTVLLGGWLWWRTPSVLVAVLRAWRISLFAGFMGTLASACWFTAMAMEPVAHVRTLGMIELVFSYVVSRRVFRERLSLAELTGLVLLAVGIIGILLR